MSRRHRIVAALFAAFALVFAQLAVSAHACEFFGQSTAAQAAPAHDCCAEDAGDGTNPAGGNVCAEHCQHAQASFDNGQPAPGLVETAGPALRVDAGEAALSADRRPAWLLVPPAASPPAAILFGVLRI
jgi:hypothetical protein